MARRKVEVFEGANGRWYWHLVAGNGKIIDGITQPNGYVRKGYCIRMASELNPGVKVEVLDG